MERDIKHSPWGAVESITKIGETIVFIETASHGGFYLEPHINAEIPDSLRRVSGYYEEDCEATIVVCCFPHLFKEIQVERAQEGLKYWYGQSAVLAVLSNKRKS